jgi:hypothetical protein
VSSQQADRAGSCVRPSVTSQLVAGLWLLLEQGAGIGSVAVVFVFSVDPLSQIPQRPWKDPMTPGMSEGPNMYFSPLPWLAPRTIPCRVMTLLLNVATLPIRGWITTSPRAMAD